MRRFLPHGLVLGLAVFVGNCGAELWVPKVSFRELAMNDWRKTAKTSNTRRAMIINLVF